MSRPTNTIRFDRCYPIRPTNNIISSDFAKYVPPDFNYMKGVEDMNLVMSNEYNRLWRDERDKWRASKFPKILDKVDIVKRYVQTFKANYQHPKVETKKPFKMKKFDKVSNKTNTRWPKEEPEKKASAKATKEKERNFIKNATKPMGYEQTENSTRADDCRCTTSCICLKSEPVKKTC